MFSVWSAFAEYSMVFGAPAVRSNVIRSHSKLGFYVYTSIKVQFYNSL